MNILLFLKGHMTEKDHVGDNYTVIALSDWDKWFDEHKHELENLSMKLINNRFRIYDGKNRYKLHKIRGKYIVKRCGPDEALTKHTIMNKVMELSAALLELKKQIENVETDEEVVKDLNTKTKRFKV